MAYEHRESLDSVIVQLSRTLNRPIHRERDHFELRGRHYKVTREPGRLLYTDAVIAAHFVEPSDEDSKPMLEYSVAASYIGKQFDLLKQTDTLLGEQLRIISKAEENIARRAGFLGQLLLIEDFSEAYKFVEAHIKYRLQNPIIQAK